MRQLQACGQLFYGTAEQMWNLQSKFKVVPDDAPELAGAIGMAGKRPVDIFAEVRTRKDSF